MSAITIHMFAFRWKSEASAADRQRAYAEIKAFSGVIPGLLEVHVGDNVATHSGGYGSGGVMKFTDAAALSAYQTHPRHQALLEWLVPLIDAIEVDFPSAD